MSEQLFDHDGVRVERWTGPQADPLQDRCWYSIFLDENRTMITLNPAQWRTLAEFFTADCSSDCESPRLTRPIPATWRWFDG